LHGAVVAGQIGIAIKHEEALRQQMQRLPDRACSTQQPGTIECIVDPDSKFHAIPESFLNPFSQVTDRKHDVTKAISPEKFELMPEEGMASDLD
jgi:hypothetical protein